MRIEPWEETGFVDRFAAVKDYDAVMWLEDGGCYNSITGNNCELLLGVARAIVDGDISQALPEKLRREFWAWAKSAAIEELEKLNRESGDD